MWDEKRRFPGNERGKKPKSGRFDGGLVNQHYGEAVAHWIDTMALRALKRLGVGSAHQWLDAYRAGHQLEQVFRNHNGDIVRRCKPIAGILSGEAQLTTETQRHGEASC